MAAAKRQSSKPPKTAPKPETPDVLGDDNRRQLARQRIAALQAEAFNLDLVRLANGDKRSAQAPGSNPPASYGALLAKYENGIKFIVAEHGDLLNKPEPGSDG